MQVSSALKKTWTQPSHSIAGWLPPTAQHSVAVHQRLDGDQAVAFLRRARLRKDQT